MQQEPSVPSHWLKLNESGAARARQASVQRSLRLLPRRRWYPHQPESWLHRSSAGVHAQKRNPKRLDAAEERRPGHRGAQRCAAQPRLRRRLGAWVALSTIEQSTSRCEFRLGGLPEQPHHVRRHCAQYMRAARVWQLTLLTPANLLALLAW